MTALKKTSFIVSLLTTLVISAVALTGCSSTSSTGTEPVTINLAAAASLTDVMEAINDLYVQQNPHVTITPSYASSGALTQQIQQGAPVDIFMSAGASQMDTLQNESLIINETRRNLLKNTMVLIVPDDSTLGIDSFEDLTGEDVELIAIGDPASVPAGKYAKQALEFYGIYSQLESAGKFIIGANVRDVLTYVQIDEVDAGIVYSTDIYTTGAVTLGSVQVVANGPDSVNDKIVYPVAITSSTEIRDAVEDFEDFLFSDEAGEIFEEYGFTVLD